MDTSLQVPQEDKPSQPASLVQETIHIFEHMRNGTVRAMQLLYAVKQTEAWTEVADSFGEFCEQDLGISQSYASKLLSTWDHYVIKGGVSPKTLEGTDYERFYLARQLPGTVDEQVNAAKTLSRREIKQERNEVNVHEHEWIEICKVCSLRKTD